MTNPFSLGYQSGEAMAQVTLDWTGAQRPDWLRARYVQNGPGLFSVGTAPYHHWFDGLSMLKRFDIGEEVLFQARFLESPDYAKATATDQIGYTEFATVPDRSIWQRIVATLPRYEFGKNASINILPLVDEVLAIGDLPGGMGFDPATLATTGAKAFHGPLLFTTTPHPQRDNRRKEWVNVGLGLSWRGVGYNVFGLPDGSQKPRPIAFIPRQKPAYMHSVGASDSYVVVAEHPIFVNLAKMMTLGLRNKPIVDAIDWQGDEPLTLFVVSKDDGEVVATVETSARLYFHHTNVFERGDQVIIDLCTYPDARIIDELYLDQLRSPSAETSPATLTRYTVDVPRKTVSSDVLCDVSVEFPKINPDYLQQDYRYTYAVSFQPGFHSGQANQLVKVDVVSGEIKTWSEPGIYPTEPFLVPRPGSEVEDDGVLLSVVLDTTAERSALVILDAHSLTEIGRAAIPSAFPFGFHGQVMPM